MSLSVCEIHDVAMDHVTDQPNPCVCYAKECPAGASPGTAGAASPRR